MNKPKTPECNYTQVPNLFFDYWMRYLTYAEFKVLFCLARKTFGWRKNQDKISLSQIISMTGMGKSSVAKAIIGLEENGLIEKERNQSQQYGHTATSYCIVVSPIGEELKNGLACPPQGQGYPCPPQGQALVHHVDTQKKDLTKEKEQQHYAPKAAPLETPKKVVVVVPSSLSEIGGTAEDWVSLQAFRESEEVVLAACEVARAQGARPDSIPAWIRSCIDRGFKPPAPPEDVIEKNKAFAERLLGSYKGSTICGYSITVLNTCVEFAPAGQAPVVTIDFNKKAFQMILSKFWNKLQNAHRQV